MVDNIERRGILRDADVIKVWDLGEVDIENDNLPAPDNCLVSDK